MRGTKRRESAEEADPENAVTMHGSAAIVGVESANRPVVLWIVGEQKVADGNEDPPAMTLQQ